MSIVMSLDEKTVGEIWTDNVEGKKVVTVNDPSGNGCRHCAYSSLMGGACPGLSMTAIPAVRLTGKTGKTYFTGWWQSSRR